jgi:MraZ protein
MALFLGEFETTIDGKHRLAISSEFRQQILPEQDGDGFVLMLGPDRHLWLYPDAYYQRLAAKLKRSPLPSREAGKLTMFFAMSQRVKPDAQGRIVLPEKSMSRAIVAEQVTLVGNDDHLEIWPTQEWEKRVEQLMPSYGEILYEASDRLGAERQEPQPERKLTQG